MNYKMFKNVETIDPTTGEVTVLDIQLPINDTDNWLTVYFKGMDILCGLNKCLQKVLMACLKTCTYNETIYNGNIVHNDGYLKKIIEIEYGIKPLTVNNSINILCKKGILIKKAHGLYLINPELFWKGKITKRTKGTIRAIKQPNENFENGTN